MLRAFSDCKRDEETAQSIWFGTSIHKTGKGESDREGHDNLSNFVLSLLGAESNKFNI